MSQLSTLKAVAAADLASTKSTVTNYVKSLETSVATNKYLLGGTSVVCLVLGYLAAKVL